MKNKFKKHGFWKQRKQFLKYAAEIYKMFVDGGQVIIQGNVTYNILKQSKGFQAYYDLLLNSMELDERIVAERESYLDMFAEESDTRMQAGILFDDDYVKGAAINVGRLVVKIAKYIRLCSQLGITPVAGEDFGSVFK